MVVVTWEGWRHYFGGGLIMKLVPLDEANVVLVEFGLS